MPLIHRAQQRATEAEEKPFGESMGKPCYLQFISLIHSPSVSSNRIRVVHALSFPWVCDCGAPVQEFLWSLCEPAEATCLQNPRQQISKVFCVKVFYNIYFKLISYQF